MNGIAGLLVRHHLVSSLVEVPGVVRLEGMRLTCPPGHHLLRAIGRVVRWRIRRADGALWRKRSVIRVARHRWRRTVLVGGPVEVGLAWHGRVVVDAGRRAQGNLRHGGGVVVG